jgi:hypothetical protein
MKVQWQVKSNAKVPECPETCNQYGLVCRGRISCSRAALRPHARDSGGGVARYAFTVTDLRRLRSAGRPAHIPTASNPYNSRLHRNPCVKEYRIVVVSVKRSSIKFVVICVLESDARISPWPNWGHAAAEWDIGDLGNKAITIWAQTTCIRCVQ